MLHFMIQRNKSRAIIPLYKFRLPLQADTALKACTDYRIGGT